MSRIFPNGSTFKGRFEFVKDVRCFYYAMATATEAYVELVSYTEGNDWDIDATVTFKIWVGKEGVPEGVVKRFLQSVYDAGEKIEALTAGAGDDYAIVGLEPHVFCQSVKLLEEYDGERDDHFSC
jgi:hypothetical protein